MAFSTTLWGKDSIGFGEKFLSVDEVMVQSGLDFTVEAQPVFLGNGIQVPKCKATVRTDNGIVLGTVGDRYEILQNQQAFAWFQPFVDNKLASIEHVGTLKNGQITFIQAKVETDPVEITAGDAVESYITLLNSHSGVTSVFAGFFPRRIFCTNQMPALKASKHLKVKHTKNVHIAMDKIQQIMDLSNQEFLATTEQYRYLASKGVNKADLEKYVKLVFKKDENDDKEMRESKYEQIESLFETGRGAKETPNTMFKAFNAVNEYLNYEVGRGADTRLQSLWIGANAQMNQRAFDVAMQIASDK